MEEAIISLINQQHSSDNETRIRGELQFDNLVAQDSSVSLLALMNIALDFSQLSIALRQSALLHLKRLVPKYWSLAFQSFVGPPVSQEVKLTIRNELLRLATSDPDSKIRSGSAYCIVQIGAVDYPDEWPDLLAILYSKTNDLNNEIQMLGSLTVLHDLFDDLVTEEQFFEGGVGQQIIEHTTRLLLANEVTLKVKIAVARLFRICLNQFQGPAATATPTRKMFVEGNIPNIVHLLTNLLNDSINQMNYAHINIDSFIFRTELYKIVTILLTHFPTRLYPIEAKHFLQELITRNLSSISNVFIHVLVLNDNSIKVTNDNQNLDSQVVLENYIVEVFQTLGSIYKLPFADEKIESFTSNIINLSLLTLETQEKWMEDFNSFVTDSSGMSAQFTIRDGINEYLSELNNEDAKRIFFQLVERLNSVTLNSEWQLKETILFMFESLFINEDSDLATNIPIIQLFNKFTEFIKDENPLVRARCCLMLPRFLEKFSENLSIKEFGSKTFNNCLQSFVNDDSELVKSATLIASTYYKHMIDLGSLPIECQVHIFNIIISLIEDSEEDSLSILLEALTTGIEINNTTAASDPRSLDLIFQISFKDASNVQLIIDSKESLTALLENINAENYVKQCEKGIPAIVETVQKNLNERENIEYSPELNLSLELLSIFIEKAPSPFSSEVFKYVFPVISGLLIKATDDQILQSGGEVFDELLKRAPDLILEYQTPENERGMDIILRIVAKLLSPDLSDSAAINVGSIIVSLVEKFQSYLGEYLPQILEAVARRLIVAKGIITIEDLITVFCYLVLLSPEDTINFLVNLNIDGKNGLELVFPIWFSSYEVTRGYEKIKKNTLALGKIFSVGDARVENLIVDGDLVPHQFADDVIVTRSMAAAAPQRYTQISASQKILKLLLSELNFQCQQPDASDYLPDNIDASGDGEDEGWEELDDIGVPNYDKLKEYINSDDEGDSHQDQNGDDALKQILVQFFKEAAVKNLGNFKRYFELLADEEKKILMENVAF